mmetsp:Transcript_71091/g.125985  ORF Transcript_71091/g.125985 Transcript_71091/m.125985 type:complete len:312 (-) Transcript_71091:48-983(-)
MADLDILEDILEQGRKSEAAPRLPLPMIRIHAGERDLPEVHLMPDGADTVQRYVVQPDSDAAVAYQLRVTSCTSEDQWLEIYIDGQWATSWLLRAGTEDFIQGWHVGTSIEENSVSYKVRPFMFAKPQIVEEAEWLPDFNEHQGTIIVGVFNVDRKQTLFNPAAWETGGSAPSERIVGENKTDKKHELFRGYTDLGCAQSEAGESLVPGYHSIMRGPKHWGTLELHYDTSAALMLRSVPPESLGLKVEAVEEVKADRGLVRAQRRRLELLEKQRSYFVETCDLTAEEEECEVWVKRRRTQDSPSEHGGVLD